MAITIFFDSHFNSAHQLPNGPIKCRRMHGHTYHVTLEVQAMAFAQVDRNGLDERGFVIEYDEVRAVWLPLHEQLDHNTLNDVPGLENPTAEHIALWIFDKLTKAWPKLPDGEPRGMLVAVTVRETPTCGATVRYNPLEVELASMKSNFGRRLAELRLEKEAILNKRGPIAWYARQLGWHLRPDQWGELSLKLGVEGTSRWLAVFDARSEDEVRERWAALEAVDHAALTDELDETQLVSLARLARMLVPPLDVDAS